MRLDTAFFLVGVALAVAALAIPYRWRDMPNWMTTIMLCVASAMVGAAVALLLEGSPAPQKVAKAVRSPDCISAWGVDHTGLPLRAVHVNIDGDCVMDLVKDQTAYYISVVVFHPHYVVALLDEPILAKSAPLGIGQTGSIYIEIPVKKSFPEGGTYYGLLIVPRNVSPDQFSTMHEAMNLGAIFAGLDGGPP